MSLKEALMNSQEISATEADKIILKMRRRIWEGEDAEEILDEEGLEPDYVFDLIG